MFKRLLLPISFMLTTNVNASSDHYRCMLYHDHSIATSKTLGDAFLQLKRVWDERNGGSAGGAGYDFVYQTYKNHISELTSVYASQHRWKELSAVLSDGRFSDVRGIMTRIVDETSASFAHTFINDQKFDRAYALAKDLKPINADHSVSVLASLKAAMTVRLEEIGTSSLRFADSEAAVAEQLSSGDLLLAMLPEADPIRIELTERFTGLKTAALAEVARCRDERERIAAAAAAKTSADARIVELERQLTEMAARSARLEAERDAARVKAATFEAAAADAAKARSATPARPRPTAVAGGAGARPSPVAARSATPLHRMASPAASAVPPPA